MWFCWLNRWTRIWHQKLPFFLIFLVALFSLFKSIFNLVRFFVLKIYFEDITNALFVFLIFVFFLGIWIFKFLVQDWILSTVSLYDECIFYTHIFIKKKKKISVGKFWRHIQIQRTKLSTSFAQTCLKILHYAGLCNWFKYSETNERLEKSYFLR